MLQYTEFPPPQSLRDFVECFWMLKADHDYFRKRELIIPGGRIEMIFNLGGTMRWIDSRDQTAIDTSFGSFVLGPRNRHFFVVHDGAVDSLGVRFRHGGFAPFTTIPMSVLMNAVIPQAQIFGSEAAETLTDQISITNDPNRRVAKIEEFLKKQFRDDPQTCEILRLISCVKQYESTESLQTLTAETGVHYKKLERIFARYTGYGPKNFHRVVRFYKTLQSMKKKPTSLTDAGIIGGYYDQPHFIRDFKAFTGKSPRQFEIENPVIANFLLRSKHV